MKDEQATHWFDPCTGGYLCTHFQGPVLTCKDSLLAAIEAAQLNECSAVGREMRVTLLLHSYLLDVCLSK